MKEWSYYVSQVMIEKARKALLGQPIRETERFEVYDLPPDDDSVDQLVLLIWQKGDDFPEAPKNTILFPVTIDGRQGYLWYRERALGYEP